jgi:predicted CopG family antitoxin
MRKTITIKVETWKKISNLKIEKNLRSLDEAINYLLEKMKK